jgi:streptogramin lyase
MQDTRARLRDELGLDPSQALQQLEKQILLQDPALEPARVVKDAPQPEAASPALAPVARARLPVVTRERRRRRRWPLAAAALGLAAAVVGGVLIASHVDNAAGAPVSLLRFDPSTARFVAATHDRELGCPCGVPDSPNLWAVDGTLWERTGSQGQILAIRSLQTGRLLRTLPIPAGTDGFTIGYGAVWLVHSTPTPWTVHASGTVERVDELSGRVVAKLSLRADLGNGTIATGTGAVWVLDQDGALWRIDPGTNRATGHFETGAVETTVLVAAAGYEWISERLNHDVLRYDPATRRAKRFQLAQQPWHLVAVESPKARSVWLLDGQGNTITRLDSKTGKLGQPFGLTGRPSQAVLTRGSIWVAENDVVDRISVATGARTTITLPKGTHATGIAVDPVTGTVWVDNSIEGCGFCGGYGG